MAITLDTIVNKVFHVVQNGGYDNNEVESFLDEILEEMENREQATIQLQNENAAMKKQLEEMTEQLEKAKTASSAAYVPPVQKPSESFELVLTKAKDAYEEIVAAADLRAEEIIQKATADAASMRGNAEQQIADLMRELASVKQQTSNYYTAAKQLVDAQNAALDQMKKLL